MPAQLSDLTTFHIGGPARRFERANSAEDLAHAVLSADLAGEAVLVLGGGSNLLVADRGFDGVVLQDTRAQIGPFDDGTKLRVSAGTTWDQLVAYTIENGLAGVEALSGIPGTVGAAPVQNIGAYGQEVSETLTSVRVLDRATGQQRTLSRADLQLDYRTSVIKRSAGDAEVGGGRTWGPTGRWVVLDVEFQMRNDSLSMPVKYRELATSLGIDIGERAPAADVRQAVLELRRGKGMVASVTDRDTWSAGSFFTNPIVAQEVAALLPPGAPRFPVQGRFAGAGMKTSAAWLIGQAGFTRGYRVTPEARASLSTKHLLALTNRGEALAEDVLSLAREVRDGVESRFGIRLVPEPVLVGLEL